MSSRPYRVLCLGDSRLNHMQLLLNDNHRKISFSCFVFPGATLGRLAYETRIILCFVEENYYDYIFVLGGICDLTVYQKRPTRWISLAYPTVASLVENFERLYSLCRSSIGLFTKCPLVFATISGIHLNRYMESDSPRLFQQQPILDSAIPLLNVIIKESARFNFLPVIDLAKYIHHSKGKGGVYRTRYCKLYDGCHPDSDTRTLWADEILKVFTNHVYMHRQILLLYGS